MRDAASQALNAANTAGQTATGYGAGASTIGSTLVPQLSRQLQNPSGYSQQDIGAMLSSALASSGGSTSGLYGAAGKEAMTTRNPMGFSGALDAAAMQRNKANASASEGISAKNADVKLNQQEQAGDMLSRLYGMDVSAQNTAAGQVAPDVNASVNANNSGWLQNVLGIIKALNGK